MYGFVVELELRIGWVERCTESIIEYDWRQNIA
jgi:hypothetical protein